MTDLPVSDRLTPPPRRQRSRRRSFLGALPGLLYIGVVLALFGGIAIDRLPQNPLIRFALVAIGAGLVVLVALWLDHREAQSE
jgi:hypothetical protein